MKFYLYVTEKSMRDNRYVSGREGGRGGGVKRERGKLWNTGWAEKMWKGVRH